MSADSNSAVMERVNAWAGEGGRLCTTTRCERDTEPNAYCLECHLEAWNALREAKLRFVNAWAAIFGVGAAS